MVIFILDAIHLRILGPLLQSGQGDFSVNSKWTEAYLLSLHSSPLMSEPPFLGISILLKNGVLFAREGHSGGGCFNDHLLSWGAQLAEGSTQEFVINK